MAGCTGDFRALSGTAHTSDVQYLMSVGKMLTYLQFKVDGNPWHFIITVLVLRLGLELLLQSSND